MAKREGELTPKEAAFALEADYRTITRWARRALEGEPSPIARVRRDATGHLFLHEAEIVAITARHSSTDLL